MIRGKYKSLLVKSDDWKYVSGQFSRPTDSQEKALDWDINDSKAKSDLILSISTSEFRQVKNCET